MQYIEGKLSGLVVFGVGTAFRHTLWRKDRGNDWSEGETRTKK